MNPGFRHMLILLLCSFAGFICAQNGHRSESDNPKNGMLIRSLLNYSCQPNCSASDSALIEKLGSHSSTVYIRDDQLRFEETSDNWGYQGQSITIFPEKSDTIFFNCRETKYLNYFIPMDSRDFRIVSEDFEERSTWFEELPEVASVSGIQCKTGILHNADKDWLIHYTDEVPIPSTPHRIENFNRLGFRHQKVPGFIVRSEEIPDLSSNYMSLSQIETVQSVEYLPLHDSLFVPPQGFVQFADWDLAEEEYMNRWKADAAKKHVLNPMSEEEKNALYGHWISEDEWGLHYLHIEKNPNQVLYGDSIFVQDFMFRKRERSSGTIGNWKCELIDRTLFHELGRSWDFSWETDELKSNHENGLIYRRASESETKASMRECDLVWDAWDMADSLEHWGYSALLVENNGRMADSLWNLPDGEEILKRVAYRSGSSRIQRFLAAEIIFRKDPTYPPQDDKQLLYDLSHAYANALSYDYAPYGEYWGDVEKGTIGICGEHLLRIGPAAIAELTQQTLNQEFDFYLEYQSGPVGTMYGPRKNDHAAFFICHLIGEKYTFKKEKVERNEDMEKLRKKLKEFDNIDAR